MTGFAQTRQWGGILIQPDRGKVYGTPLKNLVMAAYETVRWDFLHTVTLANDI